MTDEPTDEALENLFAEETGFDIDDFPAAIFDFARAVLAKWGGSPVVAGEPQPSTEGPPELWLQLHGDCAEPELSEPVDYTAGDVTWCWHSIHDSDVRYVRADLTTTPQPTQTQPVAREPLPKFLALKFYARRDKKATVTLLFPGHEAADAWVRGIKGG